MATLRFKAKDGHLVRVPGSSTSGFPRYVGKKFNPETKELTDSEKPFECDSGSPEGQRLISEVVRFDSLECADDATKAICGKLPPKNDESGKGKKASAGGNS